MKKNFIAIILMLISAATFAKKVKFAVNVDTLYASGLSVNPSGMHIYGNFQGAAGYPYDWDPGSTLLIQDPVDTEVYSIVLDLPAFHTYEYLYINGDQAYQVEFIPPESRANGNFDDSRWIYVDSTANDTTFIGAVQFDKNAPVGLTLVRFRVNMNNETVSPDGVHVAGDFQGWQPGKTAMGEVVDLSGIYEYEAYVLPGTYNYKFVNGITSADYEYVSGACATNGNRTVVVTQDVMLDAVNFSSCLVGINEHENEQAIHLFPNPSTGSSKIEFNDNELRHTVNIYDISGRVIRQFECENDYLQIENLDAGIYHVMVMQDSKPEENLKLIIQ